MTQNKFAFFANFSEAIKALPVEKQAGAYQAICEYGIYGTLPDDPMYLGLCLMAKASIYKEDGRVNNGGNHNPQGINQHSENGQSGQKRSKLVNSVKDGQILSETETETRNIETEIEKEKHKEKVAVATRFTKPTLDQIKSYNQESGLGIDEQAFMDFYESKGWKVGSSPMKDWKAAVRNWARRDKENQPAEQVLLQRYECHPEERPILIEDGRFYMDDTMPEYKEALVGVPQETIERCYKWILENKRGKAVRLGWILEMIKKFSAGDERMVANG